jgi:hypothetical protein
LKDALESIFSLRSETDLSPLNGGVYESIPYCCNAYEICTSSVGANGRTFERVDLGKNKVIQRQYTGKNDFVGHTWTLPRVITLKHL